MGSEIMLLANTAVGKARATSANSIIRLILASPAERVSGPSQSSANGEDSFLLRVSILSLSPQNMGPYLQVSSVLAVRTKNRSAKRKCGPTGQRTLSIVETYDRLVSSLTPISFCSRAMPLRDAAFTRSPFTCPSTWLGRDASFPAQSLGRKPLPFDDPAYLFELKYDGFRAPAVVEYGRCTLYSRNGHLFASLADLAARIRNAFMPRRLVMEERSSA